MEVVSELHKFAKINAKSLKRVRNDLLNTLHRRAHMLWGSAKKGHWKAGAVNQIKEKHDALASEMVTRGMNHTSPLPEKKDIREQTKLDFYILELFHRRNQQ